MPDTRVLHPTTVKQIADAKKRRQAMKRLRDAGKTLEEIGREFGGISRERVRQILSRA